jgi:hypothetical protein
LDTGSDYSNPTLHIHDRSCLELALAFDETH